MKNLIVNGIKSLMGSSTALVKPAGKYQQVKDDHNWLHPTEEDRPLWVIFDDYSHPDREKARQLIIARMEERTVKQKEEWAEAKASGTEAEYLNFIEGIRVRCNATSKEREIEERFMRKHDRGRTKKEMQSHLLKIESTKTELVHNYKEKTGQDFPKVLPSAGELNEADSRDLPVNLSVMSSIIKASIQLHQMAIVYRKAVGEFFEYPYSLWGDSELEPIVERLIKKTEARAEAKPNQKKKKAARPAPKTGVLAEALELFELKQPFTAKELTARRRQLLAKVHPDAGGSASLFKQVETAHGVLKRHLG